MDTTSRADLPQYEATDEPALAPAHTAEDGLEPSVVEAELASEDSGPGPQGEQGLATGADLDRSDEITVKRTDAQVRAVLEAIIYITDEPLTLDQMSSALGEPLPRVKKIMDELVSEFAEPQHGIAVQEVAGGYKIATKPEHHETVRAFVKKLKAPLKLSLAALETLSVIAYKQPITAPEIMEVRGVQGAGVLKTLLDRKLIATAGRKNVIGKPILYKTTREFLVQFGLKDLNELPTLKEFEELGRLAVVDEAEPLSEIDPQPEPTH